MVTAVEGCNEFCTFCIVPYTRGREVNRALADILNEVEHLAATGLKEIELLGQTINAYECPETGSDFSDLLSEVAACLAVYWLGGYGLLAALPLLLFAAWLPVALDRKWSKPDKTMDRFWKGSDGEDREKKG